MAHVIETPRLGDWVTIHVDPGCDQEFKHHGIAPLVNYGRGQIRALDSHGGTHFAGVDIGSHRQWFAPSERLAESVEEIIARLQM